MTKEEVPDSVFDGEALVRLREFKMPNCNNEQAAALFGVDVLTLRLWEKGAREPRLRNIVILAAALGVSVQSLLKVSPTEVSC
jgi:transcriptional regulator with XRE-family HTH domain